MTQNLFSNSAFSEDNSSSSYEKIIFNFMSKRLLFVLAGILISLILNAQISKSLNVTAGSLSSALTATELETVTNLILTGTIDARDFKTMRDLMPVLAEIDISKVTIAAYSGEEGTVLHPGNFPANTLPDYAFINTDTWTSKTNLTSILLPESITSLGVYCFSDCSGLTSIAIPSSVTSIGSYAFDGCSNLTTVSIPPLVTSIGIYAFRNCNKLSSVVIPSTVTSIGEGTFSNCRSLTSIVIPSSITSIGEIAFGSCELLTSVTIPSSVISIEDGAFYNCTRLSSIIIPASVTSIGFRVFESCGALVEVDANNPNYSSLDGVLFDKAQITLIGCSTSKTGSVTIPPTVTTINSKAFFWCSNLTTVTIPSSVTTIGEEAFSGCSVTSIVIPPSVTTIAANTFNGCSKLTSITIPSSVTTIGEYAFCYCNKLLAIEIPPSVTTIGRYAFDNCISLTTISIPSSVISIGSLAFRGCTGLIEIDSNNPNYSSLNGVIYNKDKTTLIQCPDTKTGKFVIPSSVTSIGNSAFLDCKNLTFISIPSTVISINGGAFAHCYRLTFLIASNPIPVNFLPFASVFDGIHKTTCTLYVPIGSKSAYQAAPLWKDFTNIIENQSLTTGIEPIINYKQLIAYPNPTLGRVKLILDQIPQSGTYLTVTDVTGRMILKTIMLNKEEIIDLQGNSPGGYFIKTDLPNSKVQKIILK